MACSCCAHGILIGVACWARDVIVLTENIQPRRHIDTLHVLASVCRERTHRKFGVLFTG